jgi:hypothetical protein
MSEHKFHMDFDAFNTRRREQRSCTVLGQQYTGMRSLSAELGLKLHLIDTYPAEEQDQIIRQVIDYAFREGVLATWEAHEDFTSEYCAQILAYILAGYVPEAVERMQAARDERVAKNGLSLTAPPLTSVSTGDALPPISAANTGSTSGETTD